MGIINSEYFIWDCLLEGILKFDRCFFLLAMMAELSKADLIVYLGNHWCSKTSFGEFLRLTVLRGVAGKRFLTFFFGFSFKNVKKKNYFKNIFYFFNIFGQILLEKYLSTPDQNHPLSSSRDLNISAFLPAFLKILQPFIHPIFFLINFS